jgi:aminoglycoside phosphotransferase (APT) family kinase protein
MKSDKTKLIQIIKKYLPNFTWNSVKYIGSGYDHDVLVFDNETVFRFPKNNYSKKLLKDEIALLKIISNKTSVATPNYKYLAKDCRFAWYPLLKGDELTIKRYRSLSEFQQNKLSGQIATFLTELHFTSLTSIKNCHPRERFAEKEIEPLRKETQKYLYPQFSDMEKQRCESFFTELANIFRKKYKKVLVHGDFSGDHLIINQDNGLSGVIDFTDRAIHDPAFDFIFLWELGNHFVEKVYDSYHGSKNGILQRSKMYAGASALWNMVQSVKKKKMNYKKWEGRFKQMAI